MWFCCLLCKEHSPFQQILKKAMACYTIIHLLLCSFVLKIKNNNFLQYEGKCYNNTVKKQCVSQPVIVKIIGIIIVS
jgi:hypothetical protein